MTEREALIRAICTHPDEDTPRLAFADWLDEHAVLKTDRMWAALIRAQIARLRSGLPNCNKLGGSHQTGAGICEPARRCRCPFCRVARCERDASRRCCSQLGLFALEPVTRNRPRNHPEINYAFPAVWLRRGFPELLSIEAHEFVASAGELFARSPLTEIGLAGNIPSQFPDGLVWDTDAPDRRFRWRDGGRASESVRFAHDELPTELFELLPGGLTLSVAQPAKLYESYVAARNAESEACLAFGRSERDRLWAAGRRANALAA